MARMGQVKVVMDIEPMRRQEKVGHGNYVAGIYGALEAMAEVELVGAFPDGAKENISTPQRFYWDQWLLPRRARKSRAEVLHLTSFSVPLLYSGKRIVTVHDLALRKFPGNMKGISGWFLGRFTPWTFRFADHIIAVSEATKRDIVSLLKIPKDRITVVPEAVSSFYTAVPQSEARKALEKFKLEPQKYFLFVGTLEPRKNLPFLISVLAPILRQHPTYKLVLAGKRGWQFEEIFEMIGQERIASQVVETGYIRDEEKRGLYSGAFCFCYPSQYEGFGLPILEAFACGCPVVVANNSSLPEVAGDAGAVLPLEKTKWQEAIMRLMTESELRTRYIEDGLVRAKKFTWEEAARQTVEVYKKVASSSSSKFIK